MNINDITITSLETINAFDIVTGAYKFTLDELQNATIAQTQEKTKVDDKTTKIAKPAADEKNAAADKADAPAEDSTRKFDFGELKFGADYDPKKTK